MRPQSAEVVEWPCDEQPPLPAEIVELPCDEILDVTCAEQTPPEPACRSSRRACAVTRLASGSTTRQRPRADGADSAAARIPRPQASPLRALLGLQRSGPRTPARLERLELENFMVFEKQSLSLAGGVAACVVGPNSSGKTSLAHAIRFVCLCGELVPSTHLLVRCGEPPCEAALVTAHFAAAGGGTHTLRRETRSDASPGRFWIATQGSKADKLSAFRELAAEEYRAILTHDLHWDTELIEAPQFSLLAEKSATKVLEALPKLLLDAGVAARSSPASMKRKAPGIAGSASRDRGTPLSGTSGGALAAASAKAEAWLTRRVDDVYRELSRVPVDDRMEDWGEGGQALLRRSEGGSFSMLVSRRRGVASAGNGTPLESLSDGEQDLCAIALLLALPALHAGFGAAPAAFALLDEPDSRLDRRHAKALRRFLEGPLGPKQSVLLSLNNHRAFASSERAVHHLDAPRASDV